MTGDPLLDLVISLAGVAALVGLAFLLGATKTLVVDEAAARERLSFDEPDFRPEAWLVDGRGRSAVALSSDGTEAAVVFAVGDGLATRRFRVGAMPASAEGARLVVGLKDVSRPSVAIDAPDAAAAARFVALLGARPSAGIDLTSPHAVS
ncbi:MAG: hypothetical protein K2Q06_10785 [Parvularculaceae bacterium]|nr:hypothetical protein [Parvularculaceae bacterium]